MIQITLDQLTELLFRASEQGALRAMEQVGVSKSVVTYAQIKKEIGERDALRARKSEMITWNIKGSGASNSGVFCTRKDYEKWLFKRDFIL